MNLPPQVTDRAFSRLAEIAEMTGEGKALRLPLAESREPLVSGE
jgi:hypothetical protein